MVARARNQSYQWRWHRQKLRFRVDPGLVASSRSGAFESSWRTSLGIVSWRRGDSTFPGLLFTADRASVFKELLKTERGSRVFQTRLRFLAGTEATSSLFFLFFRTRVSLEIRCVPDMASAEAPWGWHRAAASKPARSRNGYVVSDFVLLHRIACRVLYDQYLSSRRPVRQTPAERIDVRGQQANERQRVNAWSATGSHGFAGLAKTDQAKFKILKKLVKTGKKTKQI
jgi:hypothetical protein